MKFECPKCGGKALHEVVESGPTVTRLIKGVDSADCCTKYTDYWISAHARVRWLCGDCKYELPVRNVSQLIEYLESQRREIAECGGLLGLDAR